MIKEQISIITPSFNQGRYFQDTLDSIRKSKQNLGSGLQYIIIDGQPSDNTIDLVKNNIDIVDYFKSEKDNGQADAINKGLKVATGEIVNWLNSDDFLLPGCLEMLKTLATNFEDYDIYSFQNLNSKENGGYFNGWSRRKWRNDYKALYKGVIIFAQESTFIRKSFLEKNNLALKEGFRGSFDHLFYYHALVKKPRILLIDMLGGVMRIQPSSITMNLKNGDEVRNYSNELYKILGRKGIFLIRLYHHKLTKLIFFNIFLLLKKHGLAIRHIHVLPGLKIDFAECKGYDIRDVKSWKITQE